MKFRLWNIAFVLMIYPSAGVSGGEIRLEIINGDGVTDVGAIRRWNTDGSPAKPVNPKAKIDAPEFTVRAVKQKDKQWVMPRLEPGRYDLVILASSRIRIEGFQFAPIGEFEKFLPGTATAPEEAREFIIEHIGKSKHYENKVLPLFLGGDEKQVRILVQLVRDLPTSYDGEYGTPIATIRHELWQYQNNYGGWVKDRRTKVLDRILMPNKEFQQWTWVWEPRLGGIEVKDQVLQLKFEISKPLNAQTARGWFPGS